MKNISIINGRYWRVSIRRQGLVYRVTIPFGTDKAAALGRALAERALFYRLHGETAPARSNTGVAGVSESTNWVHGRPRPCFLVSFGNTHTHGYRRLEYKGLGDRETVLRQAIALRARLAGEELAELQKQAFAS